MWVWYFKIGFIKYNYYADLFVIQQNVNHKPYRFSGSPYLEYSHTYLGYFWWILSEGENWKYLR